MYTKQSRLGVFIAGNSCVDGRPGECVRLEGDKKHGCFGPRGENDRSDGAYFGLVGCDQDVDEEAREKESLSVVHYRVRA